MIKFLLYLFLFYVLSRLVFGKLMGGNTIKTKVYRYDTHHHHYNQSNSTNEPEGKITINPNINNTTKKPTDKKLGEYVDYEELK